VLVAEDNATNQKLLSAMLDQQGHHVTIVDNGRLAAEHAARDTFDIILMDVQMPEMSGLEATTAIREKERGTDRHIPIVALTARAMAGDREQCLAAGMDAYVSKPVKAEELFATMEALFGSAVPQETAPAAMPDAEAHAPGATTAARIDPAALLDAFGGRASLVMDVIDVFLTDAPEMLTRLQTAAHAGDASALAAAAHAIKGSAGVFVQGEAYARARDLEHRARAGEAIDARRAFDEVNTSVSELMRELRALRSALGA
jgi:CheY-like chemotaxis protein